MGEIVGFGLVSHVPTIMLPEEVRLEINDGKEISLVPGLRRLRSDVLDRLHPVDGPDDQSVEFGDIDERPAWYDLGQRHVHGLRGRGRVVHGLPGIDVDRAPVHHAKSRGRVHPGGPLHDHKALMAVADGVASGVAAAAARRQRGGDDDGQHPKASRRTTR